MLEDTNDSFARDKNSGETPQITISRTSRLKQNWKQVVFGIVIIIIIIGTGGVVLLKQPKTPMPQTTTQYPTVITPSPTQVSLLSGTPTDQFFRTKDFVNTQLDVSKPFFHQIYNYPDEIRFASPNTLIGMKCTYQIISNFTFPLQYTTGNWEDNQPTAGTVSDQYFINLAKVINNPYHKNALVNFIYCQTADHKTIVTYTTYPQNNPNSPKPGGAYFATIEHGKLHDITTIPNVDGLYDNCLAPIQYTSEGYFYIICGGGDVGASFDIYKVGIGQGHSYESIYSCKYTDNEGYKPDVYSCENLNKK